MAVAGQSGRPTLLLGGLALAATAVAVRRMGYRLAAPTNRPRDTGQVASRKMHGAATILALAVLGDSGIEHYRGMFANKAMITPLVTATVSVFAGLHGLVSRDPLPRGERRAVYGAAALSGLIGTGFHLLNVRKRPGGFSFENLFYGAPLGAPAAILLAGAVGLMAEEARESAADTWLRISNATAGQLSFGQAVAGLSALGLLGTSAEAALLHFRGNFQNKAMYLPVTIPPVTAGLLGWAALRPGVFSRRLARIGMRVAALLGFAGTGFHIYGVSRHMGGWRNWSQNLLDGPPIPAPPAFTGLALAGLAALTLLEDEND